MNTEPSRVLDEPTQATFIDDGPSCDVSQPQPVSLNEVIQSRHEATVYCLLPSNTIVSPLRMASDAALLRGLGKRIRELRNTEGISQERLAELASVHENHIRRIERGEANPSYLVIARIARALNVPPAEFF